MPTSEQNLSAASIKHLLSPADGAHPDPAPGTPVSAPASLKNTGKRAGSEIGAPPAPPDRGPCQAAPGGRAAVGVRASPGAAASADTFGWKRPETFLPAGAAVAGDGHAPHFENPPTVASLGNSIVRRRRRAFRRFHRRRRFGTLRSFGGTFQPLREALRQCLPLGTLGTVGTLRTIGPVLPVGPVLTIRALRPFMALRRFEAVRPVTARLKLAQGAEQ